MDAVYVGFYGYPCVYEYTVWAAVCVCVCVHAYHTLIWMFWSVWVRESAARVHTQTHTLIRFRKWCRPLSEGMGECVLSTAAINY